MSKSQQLICDCINVNHFCTINGEKKHSPVGLEDSRLSIYLSIFEFQTNDVLTI